jgi:hypothetical protein
MNIVTYLFNSSCFGNDDDAEKIVDIHICIQMYNRDYNAETITCSSTK